LEQPLPGRAGLRDFEGGGPIAFQDVGIIDAHDFFASFLHTNAAGGVWIVVRDLNQPGDCFGAKPRAR
jgi:hypothetical protein